MQQTLRVNIGTDPQTLDPRKARDGIAIALCRMLFEGLTRTSRQGNLELALAERVEIAEDLQKYIFHLRPSFWSDGKPVTSYDFAASWRATLAPSFPSDVAYQLYPIRNARQAKLGEMDPSQIGVETPDPQTLIVYLDHPVPYFLELVSLTSFFPIPLDGAAQKTDSLVGNGPFVLQSWKHGDRIALAKNAFYWEAEQVGLERIDLCMVASDTELRMFEEGDIDWAGSPLSVLPADALAALKAKKELLVHPLSGTYFFRVNTEPAIDGKKNPLSHPGVRKALASALRRGEIAEHLLQGGQTAAKSLVPPSMGLSQEGYFLETDSSRSLLSAALQEMGLETAEPLVISYSANERNATVAQAVQKQLEEGLGLRVELEAVEPKTYYRRLSQKEFQLAAGSWIADFNDPINFLEVFKYRSASTNNTGWENPKYVELLNRSELCRDAEARRILLREAEEILMREMPLIPLFHFSLCSLQRKKLEGVALSPLGQIDFRWARLAEEKEKR